MTELEEKEFNRKFDSWLDSEYDKYCEAEFDKYCQTLEQEKPKQLTQDVFKDAPEWVRSASIDSDGALLLHECKVAELRIGNTMLWHVPIGCMRSTINERGYDTTSWQHSAIDRE